MSSSTGKSLEEAHRLMGRAGGQVAIMLARRKLMPGACEEAAALLERAAKMIRALGIGEAERRAYRLDRVIKDGG